MLLIARGLNDCAVARMTGVPRSTIRDWRHRRGATHRASACPRCAPRCQSRFPRDSYAYLLGMYLGDGDISKYARTYRLRISLDMKWPGVVSSCTAAVQAVFPHNRATPYRPAIASRCVVVSVYSNHIVCLFPQHGPGPKHLRHVRLDTWQNEIVQEQPGHLLRGLLHSDGCRFINRVRINGKQYAYPRYCFTNASNDILRIFTTACDRLDVAWRKTGRNISIAQRTSVARVDMIGGPKS